MGNHGYGLAVGKPHHPVRSFQSARKRRKGYGPSPMAKALPAISTQQLIQWRRLIQRGG